MKHGPLFSLIFMWICASLPTIHAQNGLNPKPEIQVIVGDITDTRSSSNLGSRCSIELQFVGDSTAGALDVIRVIPTKAEDNLNQNLVLRETANPMAFSGFDERKRARPLKLSVHLRNPARNAKLIRILEGEVELLIPTAANGGVLVIKDFHRNPQAVSQNLGLKRLGFQAEYQTKQMHDAINPSVPGQRKVSGVSWPDNNVVAQLKLKMTNHIPYRVEFNSASGEAIDSKKGYRTYNEHVYQLTNQPLEGSQLVFTACTDGARKLFKFKVQNIPIP